MSQLKEWKKSQITRNQLNNEIYDMLHAVLLPYKTEPPHEIYNDVRLVTREILDNIYLHNKSLFSLGFELSVNAEHTIKIRIYHDGDYFDPFDPKNNCKLLLALNSQYQFEERFVGTDSGRRSLTLKFDLSSILKGKQNGN